MDNETCSKDLATFLTKLKDVFGDCKICYEPFDDIERIPRKLPCQHVFCHECLSTLTRGVSITCPECKRKHILSRGIHIIPKDYARGHLLDLMKEQKCVTACTEIGHYEYEITMYCQNEKCLKPICEKCAEELHKNHEVESIASAYMLRVYQVKENMQELNNKIQTTKEVLNKVKDLKSLLICYKKTFVMKLKVEGGQSKEYFKTIDWRIDEIRLQSATCISDIETMEKDILSFLEEADKCYKTCDIIMKEIQNKVSFLSKGKEIIQNLELVNQRDLGIKAFWKKFDINSKELKKCEEEEIRKIHEQKNKLLSNHQSSNRYFVGQLKRFISRSKQRLLFLMVLSLLPAFIIYFPASSKSDLHDGSCLEFGYSNRNNTNFRSENGSIVSNIPLKCATQVCDMEQLSNPYTFRGIYLKHPIRYNTQDNVVFQVKLNHVSTDERHTLLEFGLETPRAIKNHTLFPKRYYMWLVVTYVMDRNRFITVLNQFDETIFQSKVTSSRTDSMIMKPWFMKLAGVDMLEMGIYDNYGKKYTSKDSHILNENPKAVVAYFSLCDPNIANVSIDLLNEDGEFNKLSSSTAYNFSGNGKTVFNIKTSIKNPRITEEEFIQDINVMKCIEKCMFSFRFRYEFSREPFLLEMYLTSEWHAKANSVLLLLRHKSCESPFTGNCYFSGAGETNTSIAIQSIASVWERVVLTINKIEKSVIMDFNGARYQWQWDILDEYENSNLFVRFIVNTKTVFLVELEDIYEIRYKERFLFLSSVLNQLLEFISNCTLFEGFILVALFSFLIVLIYQLSDLFVHF